MYNDKNYKVKCTITTRKEELRLLGGGIQICLVMPRSPDKFAWAQPFKQSAITWIKVKTLRHSTYISRYGALTVSALPPVFQSVSTQPSSICISVHIRYLLPELYIGQCPCLVVFSHWTPLAVCLCIRLLYPTFFIPVIPVCKCLSMIPNWLSFSISVFPSVSVSVLQSVRVCLCFCFLVALLFVTYGGSVSLFYLPL